MQKKITLVFIIIILTMLLGTSSPGNFFTGDINIIDEGQFAAWANHMIHGKLLYKDIYITYGPLSIYPLYWLFKVFGPSAFLVRLYLTLGGTIGIIASLFLMDLLKIGKRMSVFLICIFLLIPVMNLREATGLWALYFLIKSHNLKSAKLSFVAGVLSSISFLTSPDFGIFMFAVSYFHFLISFITTKKIKTVFIKSCAFVGGVMMTFLVFAIWASYGTWLKEYIYVTKDIITSISGINVPNGMNFPNPIQAFQSDGLSGFFRFLIGHEMLLYWSLCIYFASFFYIFFSLITKKIKDQNYTFILLTIFGILTYAILLTRHGAGHYFYTLPANLIISGYFLSKISALKKKKASIQRIAVALILLYFARILYLNNPMIRMVINPLTYTHIPNNNPERVGFLSISENQKRKIVFFQKYIAKNTMRSDYIFLFNDEPSIYMLVDRVNPTNYDLPFIANTKEKRLEMLVSLIKNKPKYVFMDNDVWAVDGISNIMRLPEVYSYIKKNYITVLVSENVEIMTLK